MPMPEGSALNQSVSPMLTNIALNFIPQAGDFVARDVFPNVPVASPSGTFNIWKRGDFLRRSMKKMANAEGAPRGGFSTGTGTYSVSNYGIGTTYTAKDLAEARRGGSSDQQLINAKVQYVTIQALLELEMQTASVVTTAGNWTFAVTGVTSGAVPGTSFIQWDQAACTPVQDVEYLQNLMRVKTGRIGNKMMIPYAVWLKVKNAPDLIQRITYGGTQDNPTQVTLSQLKTLFGIQDIVIPMGTYNSAAEGATDVFADIWGKFVWIGYVNPTPNREAPSAGYLFTWDGDTTTGLPAGIGPGAGPASFGAVKNDMGFFIREYMENHPSQMVVESELWTTPNAVSADMGILLSAVIA